MFRTWSASLTRCGLGLSLNIARTWSASLNVSLYAVSMALSKIVKVIGLTLAASGVAMLVYIGGEMLSVHESARRTLWNEGLRESKPTVIEGTSLSDADQVRQIAQRMQLSAWYEDHPTPAKHRAVVGLSLCVVGVAFMAMGSRRMGVSVNRP